VYASTAALPGVEDPDAEHMKNLEHRLTFESGSRMMATAAIEMTSVADGTTTEIELEKLFTFRMKGIGYSHPEWGHGLWKGELAMASERWRLDEIDESAFENQHVQHLVRAHMDGKEGIGVLEQIVMGPYEPYGFTGIIDPL
jgi:hypothetical protein